MQCLQSCCRISWHILHFFPSWALNTARQWHIKLTGSDTQKQHHSQIRHLVWLLLFFISIPHWCISKTASTKRYVTILCKWKNCNTWLCLSMLFNTSKLLRGAASSRIPILDKERSNRFVRMIWKIQVSPLKSTQKGCNACSRVAAFLDTSCTFSQAERSTRPDNDISNWQDLTRKSNTTAK